MIDADLLGDLGLQLLEILLILFVTAVALIVARILMRRWLWPFIRKLRTGPDGKMLSLIERFIYISLIIFGLREAALVIAPDIPSLEALFFVLYWILATYFIIRLISAAADWYLAAIAPTLEGTTHEKIVPLVKYTIFIVVFALALIILMDRFGITSSALTAGLAAVGVGTLVIGLAAENIINDVISGIVISLDRPFRVGDRIEILELNTWGDVQEVGWRSTRILTRDKRMVAIPNSLIGSNMVTNYSVPNKVFRVETDVIVAYGADIEYVRGLIREALEVQEWVMKEKPIQVLLLEFHGDGVLFRARCWIEDYVDTRISVDQINTAIYTRLFEAGIIAGPASDIIVHRAENE